MKVIAVPNGTKSRGRGLFVRFWSLQRPGTDQYVKKGLLGRIALVAQDKATRWKDVGKMVCWARDERSDLEFVDPESSTQTLS